MPMLNSLLLLSEEFVRTPNKDSFQEHYESGIAGTSLHFCRINGKRIMSAPGNGTREGQKKLSCSAYIQFAIKKASIMCGCRKIIDKS